MQTVLDAVVALVGPVPAGFEPVAWVVAAILFLFLVSSAFSILYALLNWIGGRRR